MKIECLAKIIQRYVYFSVIVLHNQNLTAAIVKGRKNTRTIMHRWSGVSWKTRFRERTFERKCVTSSHSSPPRPAWSHPFSGALPIAPHIWRRRPTAAPTRLPHPAAARFPSSASAFAIIALLLLLNIDAMLILILRRLKQIEI